MSKRTDPLDHVDVAAPCPADWDAMIGNRQVRFCGQCQLNVYNLSEMSRDQAENLISRTEGRLCIRFYRRKDGTILTANCPVGLGAIRRRLTRRAKAAVSAILGFLAGVSSYAGVRGLSADVALNQAASPAMIWMESNIKKVGPRVTMGVMVPTQGQMRIPDFPTPPVVGKALISKDHMPRKFNQRVK
jgi:hypothetical protein